MKEESEGTWEEVTESGLEELQDEGKAPAEEPGEKEAMKVLGSKSSRIVMLLVTLAINSLAANTSTGQTNLRIFPSEVICTVKNNGVGLCLNFLLDSERGHPRKTSLSDRLLDMQVKNLRFPMGTISQGYLWDSDGQWGETLTPALTMDSKKMALYRNADGTLKSCMDFNEFLALCSKTNIKGKNIIITVNVFSHKTAPEKVNYQQLKQTAVEWIKYAKLKGFSGLRWQIGNEIDIRQEILPKSEYLSLYKDFYDSMKAVDPTAEIGPGTFGNLVGGTRRQDGYIPDFLANPLIHKTDFITLHEYSDYAKSYQDWRKKDFTKSGRSKFPTTQALIERSSNPRMPIVVTEYNIFGQKDDSFSNQWRGLWITEMTLDMLQTPNVDWIGFWVTHSPHVTKDDVKQGKDFESAFDLDNNMHTMAQAFKLINTTLQDKMVKTDGAAGCIRAAACLSIDNKTLTIYLINKSDIESKVVLSIDGFQPTQYEQWQLTANTPEAYLSKLSKSGVSLISGNNVTTAMPPCSFVAIKLKRDKKGK